MNDWANSQRNRWERVIEEFESEALLRHSKGFAAGCDDFDGYLFQVDEAERDSLLIELVATDLELRIKKGESCRVEDFLIRFPKLEHDQASLFELVKTEIQTRVQFETSLDSLDYQRRFPDFSEAILKLIPASANDQVNPRSRFRKQKLYRQGGLGNLWEGIDEQFGRRVAIKEVKGKFANDKRYENRFERESTLTALLEHPGIVPVHGKGVLGNGQPFYAMRFVEGNSLGSQIAKIHEAIRKDPELERIEMHRLLRQYIDVCDAIAFAHSRGVLHLDMKPANIMVGDFGETLVVDWGLARKLGSQTQEADSVSSGAMGNMCDSALDIEEEYLIAGSPAYMSPEQHAGDASRIGFATDVYGLGATLLTILTGSQNPNEAISGEENESTDVRQVPAVNSRAMRPLFSVCAKAMQPDSSQRYQTVIELKHDVERFLALDQVSSHKDTLSDRWLRFQLRNPALFAILGAFVFLAAIVSTGAAVWVKKERDVAVAAKEEAETALENEAFANRQASSKTLQLRGVVELVSNMFANPTSCGLKSEATLVEGVDYLVESAEKHPIVRTMPVIQGTLYALKAKFLKGKKEYSEAVDWYQKAADTMTIPALDEGGLEKEDPYVLEFQVGKASALHKSREYPAAHKTIEDVLKHLPHDEIADRTRFGALTVKCAIEGDQRRMQQALATIREAIQIGQRTYENEDMHMLHALKMHGQLLMATNENQAALDQFEEVKSAYDGHPLVSISTQMSIDMSIGLLWARLKQPEKARQVLSALKEQAKTHFGAQSEEYKQVLRRIGPVLARANRQAADD